MAMSAARPFRSAAALALALCLVGCGSSAPERKASQADPDPAIAEAQADPLMVDPDLSRRNPAGDALGGGGPAAAPIPPFDRSPETVEAARAEALRLAGGKLASAPAPVAGQGGGAGLSPERTAIAALAPGSAGQTCARRLDYSAIWAARLPAALPVYPRGHVQEAAGSDEPGCRLRIVSFVTPVPLGDVVDFYWTRARAAGLAPTHRIGGTDYVISAQNGPAAFAAYLRDRDGLSEVDLVTSGM